MTNDTEQNGTGQSDAEDETQRVDEKPGDEERDGLERFGMFVFTQANPRGPEQDDVSALLRLVADTVEKLGDVQIHDLVLHSEITSDGLDWPSITVYYADKPADDQD